MRVVIDRFEGNMAVLEKPDRTMLSIPRSQLPEEAKEGDVLIINGKKIEIDTSDTASRKKTAEELLKELWK